MSISVIISNVLSCLCVGNLWENDNQWLFFVFVHDPSQKTFPIFKMKSTFIGFVSQIFVLCLLKNDEISLLRAFHCHTVFAESCITTLVYCFTTYSFSKIHRHISTCIHDWRFKDKGDIVKLNQFEKEIKIERTIIRDKSCILL